MTAHATLSSPESEVALLGAAMYAPRHCEAALELRADQMADPVHAALWQVISDLIRAGVEPQPALVRDKMGTSPSFEAWGGYSRLFELWNAASPAGVAEHVDAVVDRALRRNVVALFDHIEARVADTAQDALEILGDLEAGAAEIARGSATSESFITAAEMIGGALAYAKTRGGHISYPLGVAELDETLGGLNAGEMTILAARPGMGKTVGAQTIARANAAQGKGVCFFSLEMGQHPLGLRLASDLAFDRWAVLHSGITTNPTADAAIKNRLTPLQWSMLEAAQDTVSRWPLLVDTRPGLSLMQIEAAARRQHRKWERQGIEPGPVIIDHLGRVRPGSDRRGDMRAEMADRSNGASEMAKRLGVPVVALVQLNRGVESREDKTPGLSDLRQAGELEEDARQVLFLFRPEYYLRGSAGETFEQTMDRKEKLKDAERKLFWIIAKNSHGPVGQVLTYCDIACSAIRSWDV